MTKKYTIQFTAIDTVLSKEIRISKKEYESQIYFLESQINATANDEYPVRKHITIQENDTITITRHWYSVGTADTILTCYACKQGYQLKQ